MFDREWGIGVEIPLWDRFLSTTEDGNPSAVNHASIGDVRLLGTYTGYTDLRIPLVTHVRGVQRVAPAPVGLTLGYAF